MSDAPAPTRAEGAREDGELKRAIIERDAARAEAAMYERRAQERLWRQHDAEARAGRAEAEVARLTAENERMREALTLIAEEDDVGRHDGLPEPCPAHEADVMWAVACAALQGGSND